MPTPFQDPDPPTLSDIARDLGVTKVAVSKALKDAPDIGAKLKQRVLKRARQLGYKPNVAARSLATGRTFAIGLVIPDLSHSFFGDIAKAIARRLQPQGYTLMLVSSEEDPKLEQREVLQLLERRVDGIILASSQSSTALVRRIIRAGTPVVLVDRDFEGRPADFCGVDNVAAGRLATTHLIELGRRRIAHFSCSYIHTGIDRREGYRQAIRAPGLPRAGCLEFDIENTDDAGYRAVEPLLRSRPLPDALVCFSDPVATGAERALLGAGIRIPEDMALIGAGNLRYSGQLRVPLSTIDMSSSGMGELAAESLLRRMRKSGAAPEAFLTPLRLIARESTVGRE